MEKQKRRFPGPTGSLSAAHAGTHHLDRDGTAYAVYFNTALEQACRPARCSWKSWARLDPRALWSLSTLAAATFRALYSPAITQNQEATTAFAECQQNYASVLSPSETSSRSAMYSRLNFSIACSRHRYS